MPRISADALSAAAWRQQGDYPKPPKHLGREAKAVWKEVVEARPIDFFQPGSLHLLETFCTHTVQLRRVAERLDQCTDVLDPDYADLVSTSTKLSTSLAQLAQKLRLSIQSALRTESGKLDEKGHKPSDLIGGVQPGVGKPARMN